MWKKGLIGGVIIVSGLGIILNWGYFMAHLTSEFKFEKYKTAADAKRDLLEIFPFGSQVKSLTSFLEDNNFQKDSNLISSNDLKKLYRLTLKKFPYVVSSI